MVNLNVKTCRQPYGTSICGPCCVKMCAQYFGVKTSLKTVEQYCHCTSLGSAETSLVLAANKLGLRAELYAIPSGGMFFGKYAAMPVKKVVSSLRMRAALAKDRTLSEAAELMEQGAIKFILPSREVIEQELYLRHLWIVACQYYMLSNQQERYGAGLAHFVVIQGFDRGHFIINDPLDGVRKIDKDLLLCTVYSTSYEEVSAICLGKK